MKTKNLAEITGISPRAIDDMQTVAQKYNLKRMTLFGSRARGTYDKKSDIDLAIYGCEDFPGFADSMEEDVWTLLEFDLIDMDAPTISEELKSEIKKDGVVIYEKI